MPDLKYQLKWGDTLTDLAKEYGTSVKELASRNNISNPDKIYAGNTITIVDRRKKPGFRSPREAERNETPSRDVPPQARRAFENAGNTPRPARVAPSQARRALTNSKKSNQTGRPQELVTNPGTRTVPDAARRAAGFTPATPPTGPRPVPAQARRALGNADKRRDSIQRRMLTDPLV